MPGRITWQSARCLPRPSQGAAGDAGVRPLGGGNIDRPWFAIGINHETLDVLAAERARVRRRILAAGRGPCLSCLQGAPTLLLSVAGQTHNLIYNMSLLVFGSTALDSISTQRRTRVCWAAPAAMPPGGALSLKLIGVVSTDFPRKYMTLFKKGEPQGREGARGKDVSLGRRVRGNMNNRRTLGTELGVVEGYYGAPAAHRKAKYVLLANNRPGAGRLSTSSTSRSSSWPTRWIVDERAMNDRAVSQARRHAGAQRQ